jgi:hypothetical protein
MSATVAALKRPNPCEVVDRLENKVCTVRDLALAILLIAGTLDDSDERVAIERLASLIQTEAAALEEAREALLVSVRLALQREGR